MKLPDTKLYEKTLDEWRNVPMANYICPTTKARFYEAESPRGYATIMAYHDGAADEQTRARIAARVSSCATCRLCQFRGLDESSIPDAVAYFRHSTQTYRQDLGAYRTSPLYRTETIIESEKQNAKTALVLDRVYETSAGLSVAHLLERLDATPEVVIRSAPYIWLYDNGFWEELTEQMKEVETRIAACERVFVATAAEKYYLCEVLGIMANDRVQVISTTGATEPVVSDADASHRGGPDKGAAGSRTSVSGSRKETDSDENAIVIPSVPEPLIEEADAFTFACANAGYVRANDFEYNYSVERKYFASMNDPVFASEFEDVIRGWVNDVERFAEVAGVETVVFESPTSAHLFAAKSSHLKSVSFFDVT